MKQKQTIFAIVGSASKNSSNLKLVQHLAKQLQDDFMLTVFDELAALPPFDPDASLNNTPQPVVAFRQAIEKADGILICTPEYIFSIPSGLKNALEWCVATIVFSNKPAGLITASADGRNGHEELKLILKTLGALFTEATTLLLQGIKGKMDKDGTLTDSNAVAALDGFVLAYKSLLQKAGASDM